MLLTLCGLTFPENPSGRPRARRSVHEESHHYFPILPKHPLRALCWMHQLPADPPDSIIDYSIREKNTYNSPVYTKLTSFQECPLVVISSEELVQLKS